MSEVAFMWIIGGCFLCIGGVYSVTISKVDKKEFDKHCDENRADQEKIFNKLNKMSNEITEIHTILKERERR